MVRSLRSRHYIIGAFVCLLVLFSPVFTKAAGLTQLQIEAILSLLSSFGADSTTVTNVKISLSGGTPTVVRQKFCFDFRNDLTIGNNGSAISALNQALSSSGIDTTGNTTLFTKATAADVMLLQAKYGIRQTGYVGPITRAHLNKFYNCTTNTQELNPTQTTTPIPTPIPPISKQQKPKVESKIGVVYVSESNQTYNPNWRTDLYPLKSKIENALNAIFEQKGRKFTLDFLGEFESKDLYWNPSRIAFIQENSLAPSSLERGWLMEMPGSRLLRVPAENNAVCLPKRRAILWSNCPASRCEEFSDSRPDFADSQCFKAKSYGRNFPLNTLDSSWINPLLSTLTSSNINLSNYDYRIIVLGKAGPIIPQTGEYEKNLRCNTIISQEAQGYASLVNNVIVMTENGLQIPAYYKCPDYIRMDASGWQQIIHEILHGFGAVDVYEQPLFLGAHESIQGQRNEAIKLEPESEVDKSIMAHGWAGYCNKYGATYSCKQEDLEKIYIDKYNRIKLDLD